jgi:hypothetical protein
MKLSIFTALFALGLLLPMASQAQCRSYAKHKCRPHLEPYVHSGQLNQTILRPGDDAELMMTFTAGQSYRLIICAQPILGDVSFQVMDTDRNMIYDSLEAAAEDEKPGPSFDFKVASTQQLIVKVIVPEDQGALLNDVISEGCVAILTGFKDQ